MVWATTQAMLMSGSMLLGVGGGQTDLSLEAIVMSRAGLTQGPWAMSRSMVLLWPGSLLMSMAHVTIKGHKDVSGMICHLKKPYCFQSSMLSWSRPSPSIMDIDSSAGTGDLNTSPLPAGGEKSPDSEMG